MSRGLALVRAAALPVKLAARGVGAVLGAVGDKVHDNHRQQPKLRAQGLALVREAMKDIAGTVMEVYSGKYLTPGEPGAPNNPTPQQTTARLEGRRVQVRDIERG